MPTKHWTAWLAGLLVTSPVWAQGDFLPAAALDEVKLVKYWQLQLALEPGQELTRVHRVDDQIYAATNDGYVFAIHARTGALRWLQQLTRAGYAIERPCHYGEKVVFAFPAEILMYDQQFGDPVNKRELDFPAGGPPFSDGARIFIGGIDRRFYAFDGATLFESWKVVTDGQITAQAAQFADYIYFASEDGSVYACNRENKKFQWKTGTYGAVSADLVATDDGVFVASRDNSLYLLDIIFGQIRWRARLNGPLYEPPVVAGDFAYQFCVQDGVVAIDTRVLGVDERIAWRLRDGRRALTVDDKYVYILTRAEEIVAARKDTGAIEHTIPAPGFTFALPDPENQTIYVAGRDGRLFCARPLDAPYIRAEDVRAALRAEQKVDAAAAAAEKAEQAVAEAEDALRDDDASATRSTQPAVGGKSKVSKNYGRGGTP